MAGRADAVEGRDHHRQLRRSSEVSTDVNGVKTDVTGVKADVASTPSRARKDQRGSEARNGRHGRDERPDRHQSAKIWQALRELGERNYFEFDLTKKQMTQEGRQRDADAEEGGSEAKSLHGGSSGGRQARREAGQDHQ